MDCTFTKEDSELSKNFKIPMYIITKTNDLQIFYDFIVDKLIEEADEMETKGSGWAFSEVTYLELKINKYDPLNASSYIDLPKELKSKKAIINVKNNDNKCFMWSILSAIHPVLKHAQRVTKNCKTFPEDKLDLITRKGVYPYDYMDGEEKYEETELPPKEDFYNRLNECDITDDDYKHAQNVWNSFNIKNLRKYSELYVKSDVLILADIFEKFRDVCLKTYKLDPDWYFTAPGLSWNPMLKKTQIQLDLLHDIDMVLMIEKEVDLEYPKELHDYHTDLPLAPEKKIPDGSKQEKLLTGIPYAQPPIGNLRWKKPLPLWTNASWCSSKNHFKATSFGSACFQLNPFLKQFEGQEDCLYLNIWTPTLDPEAGLEVMVWIHGGFLQFGSGHQNGLHPNGHLAKLLNLCIGCFQTSDFTVQAISLRIFFSNLHEDSRGNYGMWDQLARYEPGWGSTFRSAWLLGPALIFNRSFSDSSHYNRGHFLDKSGCAMDVQCLRKMSPKEVIGTYIWNDDASFRIRDQNDLPIQGILPEQLAVVDARKYLYTDGQLPRMDDNSNDSNHKMEDRQMWKYAKFSTSAQAVDFWPGPDDLRSWNWNQYRKYVTTSLDSFDPRISQLTMQLYNTSHEYGK
ncbi:Carboxylesterase 1E like protein [Argiope bruennichi]|uniref:Carboxylesterase 1E like protein n=1 Tax=Argiope bruennichi TaxID=94029 RepID=A0A8T0FL35_ARGBR|nr:Carboxylesterase 1E like protein [Argiope bruennichi]